jgi:amicyanin
MKVSKLVIGVIGAIIIGGGILAIVLMNNYYSKTGNVGNMNMPPASTQTTTPAPAPTSNNSGAAPSTASSVTIQNFAFSPSSITVKVGETVTWTNNDTIGHTVTSDNNTSGGPDSSTINNGKTYSFTFKKAGTYGYHCTPHPYMKGTVTVTE